MSETTTPSVGESGPTGPSRPLAASSVGRLFEGQTAVDFVGRRRLGLGASAVLIVASILSLLVQGLNLGIDFEGGVSWGVPGAVFTVEQAESVLSAAGIPLDGARIQERTVNAGDSVVKVQVGDQPESVGSDLRGAFAESAGVETDEVTVNLVSSSWGSEITAKALRALVIFL
ncbi:MAG: hypothetical protein ACO3WU_07225, partial [Ilumatobacteraceae bacterium]